MIRVENWERIRRAYHVEQKSIRGIMRETGQAYRTVKRIIESTEPGKYRLKQGRRAPVLGSYQEQIRVWVESNRNLPTKQRYTSSRIYQLLREQGYGGAESTVRHYVGVLRQGQKKVEVYLPLAFEPGQDGQVDWGEAEVILNGEQVTVQLFVMRLNYSRRTFVMAFPNQKQEAFFLGHVEAFHYFGGVPRRLTYDNLTTAVRKILQGKDRQEQERFLSFRGRYLFDTYFCTPGEGHEKGGVEHGVGYVRRQYLVPLPAVSAYQELNAYLHQRCLDDDGRQVHGQPASIGAMWQRECGQLRALPAQDEECCRTVEVVLTPYSQVVLETNRYSVPVEAACRQLVAKLYPFTVKIYRPDQPTPLAIHERCYGHGQDVFDPLHYLPLLQQRPGAFSYAKPLRQWRANWPAIYETLLAHLQAQWPDGRGVREFITILQLHRQHPVEQIEAAITQALAHHCAHADGVQLCLNQLLEPAPIPAALDLQAHPHLVGIGDQTVNLAQYDVLLGRVA